MRVSSGHRAWEGYDRLKSNKLKKDSGDYKLTELIAEYTSGSLSMSGWCRISDVNTGCAQHQHGLLGPSPTGPLFDEGLLAIQMWSTGETGCTLAVAHRMTLKHGKHCRYRLRATCMWSTDARGPS